MGLQDGPPVPSGKMAVIFTVATGLTIAAAYLAQKARASPHDGGTSEPLDKDPLALHSCRICKKSQSRGWTIRGNGR